VLNDLLYLVVVHLLIPLFTPTVKIQGPATIYWPKDGYCGDVRADGKPFVETDTHVAHRRLPLGTTGIICSPTSKKCTWTSVRDRGPWGAVRPCEDVIDLEVFPRQIYTGRRKTCYWWSPMIRLESGWTYRGVMDLTRPIAEKLKHKPFERIFFLPWKT
jgi:hypothetical protein